MENVIDSRILYHGLGMINRQLKHGLDKYIKLFRESKINGIEIRLNQLTLNAGKTKDYSIEYNILELQQVENFINHDI